MPLAEQRKGERRPKESRGHSRVTTSTALHKYHSNECSIFVSVQGGGKKRCGASLIDDNVALAQIVGAHCCDIYARLYQFKGLRTTAEGVRFA